MAVVRDEAFWKLVEEKKEEAYQAMYKEKYLQVYWITYQINGGDSDKAEEEAEVNTVVISESKVYLLLLKSCVPPFSPNTKTYFSIYELMVN